MLKKLKKLPVYLLLGVLCAGGTFVEAQSINTAGDLGLGAAFGQPMCLTGKLWLNNMAAADAFAGYHFNHNFDAHADILLHTFAFTQAAANDNFPLYIGIGGRVLLGNDSQFGLRFPLGASFLMSDHKLEFFAEIAPIIDVSDFGGDIDGLVGIRLYTF